MKEKSKLHVISFGNTKGYKNLSKDIILKIKKGYPSSTFKIYDQFDLPIEIRNICDTYIRGYGYWIWKPYIIKHALSLLDEDTSLLYIDGRSDLHSKKIQWLDEFLLNKNHSVGAWQMEHNYEYSWTNYKIFEYFNVQSDKKIIESGQFAATFSVWKKTTVALSIVDKWLNIMYSNHDMCRDLFPGLPNYAFQENRYDQSVFSVILKTHKKNNNNDIFVITDKQVFSRKSIQIQGKKHPIEGDATIKRIKKKTLFYRIYRKIIVKLK